MPATAARSLDDLARLADEVFARQVGPRLDPADHDKFLAMDLDSGEYEVDPDDYAAVMRLAARLPAAEIWLRRVDDPVVCRIRGGR